VRPLWVLVPVALAAGGVIGFLARPERTKTTTVVQIQTQAPPPPATRELVARIQGSEGGCLLSDQIFTTDTFTLRRPGNGLTEGDVVGVAESMSMDSTQCYLNVTFSISPELGFFSVHDDNKGFHWGPFDSKQMERRDWTLALNANNP
jgi:hypothetical protein